MKITTTHETLSSALATAMRATGKGAGLLPILSHVAIETDGGGITLSGTNLQQKIVTAASADVDRPGAVALDGSLLASFLGSASGDVTITVSDKHVASLKAGRAKAKIHGLDIEDMPSWNVGEAQTASFTVDGGTLRKALHGVVMSTARDESRPVLSGVHIALDGTTAALAAADGFRMARTEMEASDVDGEFTATIPAASVRTLTGIIPDDGPVTLALSGNLVQVEHDGTSWASVLIDGTFPDVQRIIPTEYAYMVSIERKALQNILKGINAFVRDNNDLVKLRQDGDVLHVTGFSGDANEVQHELTTSGSEGELPETAINANYLSDAISVLDSHDVTIAGNGSMQAVRITGGDSALTQIVMPMTINR